MRVAYYYNQPRLPRADSDTNPYGPLLAEALERRGIDVEFTLEFDERYLRRNRGRVDVLHFNWPHYDYYHDDAAIMERRMRRFVRDVELARALGYKLVWTAHNLYPHNAKHREIDHRCRVELCRLATAVIAHCPIAAARVRECFGRAGPLFVIPHGHFIDVYPVPGTRRAARIALGIPDGAFAYGFVGSIQPYKGVEQLIDAFRRLRGDDTWLVMAGGGEADYVDTVRARTAGHPRTILRTYRRAPTEEFMRVLQAADVVVLPFAATLTSGTLMLALSCARPVIAPALGCLPSTVAPDAGILYDPAAHGALIDAMETIRRWDLEGAARAALASARRFDWDEIAARTLEAYRA